MYEKSAENRWRNRRILPVARQRKPTKNNTEIKLPLGNQEDLLNENKSKPFKADSVNSPTETTKL